MFVEYNIQVEMQNKLKRFQTLCQGRNQILATRQCTYKGYWQQNISL